MVVLRVSSRAVRVQFDKEFQPVSLQRTLKSEIGRLSDLKTKKRITQPQWNLLFPRTGEQPSSKDFDITLMICLLRNLIPIDIMDRLPSATDTSLRADLSRIKYYRNMIVQSNSALVDDTDFESYWNDVTPAIIRLGGNSLKEECDDWYGRNLEAEQRDDGLKHVKDEKRVALVEEELAETKKKLIELEKEKRKELAEMNKKLIELEQEQSNPVTKNISDLKNVPLLDYGGVVTQRHLVLDSEGQPGIRPATKRMAEATTSRYESNYIKIAMVVLRVSPRAVRVQFDKEFDPVCLQRTLKSEQSRLLDLKTKKRITQPQWNLLFPRTGEQPSSKDFDITLMICLLRNLTSIALMDRLPSATDTSLGADLSRIKFYRNIILQCDSAFVDDIDFESYWNDVTAAILRLGGNSLKEECDDWYGRNLDSNTKFR